MNSRERYLKNHERIKARAIARIFTSQKKSFCAFLDTQKKNFQIKQGEDIEFVVDVWIATIASEIPDYLNHVLPGVMIEGAREPIKRYRELLPSGYSLAFDIETSQASNYLRDMTDLMLSEKNGSILKTTKDELRHILEQGVAEWMSYSQIADQIRGVDPFVFSQTRAKVIAINEVGRAYWWANHQPGRDLVSEWYVLEKEWTTSHDEKVRPEHAQNEAQWWIPFESSFSWTGDQYAPSSTDFNCRCTSVHKVVAIKKWLMLWDVRWMAFTSIKSLFDRVRSKNSL